MAHPEKEVSTGTRDTPSLVETVERLRAYADLEGNRGLRRWLEILEVSRKDYRQFVEAGAPLPERTIENLASRFGIDPQNLVRGDLNFREIAVRLAAEKPELPERYGRAAFGRRRTLIASVDFFEKVMGWRSRRRLLEELDISETMLTSSMDPVNILLMADMMTLLVQKGFPKRFFFAMGQYSSTANQRTVLAEVFSSCRNPQETYEHLFGDMMKYYELNRIYRIRKLTDTTCEVEVSSNQDIATALGVRSLGNPDFCTLKAGIMSSTINFLGLSSATVIHSKCEHAHDPVCRFNIDYANTAPVDSRVMSQNHNSLR